ncbi:hypothetical protein KO500_17115 [Cellulophaga baltica]|uniref:hypothetical protein n=1 Tax=Cellulophaga TaxID=104264 RepID=UPI001C078A6A|nr:MULTISPECIES: hypothetical protein [Cellulophaga]MBU2998163.1 hypothetical protein [Cellulophaga baltica]MDO6769567.1 hypothetical protein [Cellulophaga sp. 1_MG-2023]
MKKSIIALIALVLNTVLFSCTTEPITQRDQLYETQATEGDDQNIPPPPPEEGKD